MSTLVSVLVFIFVLQHVVVARHLGRFLLRFLEGLKGASNVAFARGGGRGRRGREFRQQAASRCFEEPGLPGLVYYFTKGVRLAFFVLVVSIEHVRCVFRFV